MYQCFYISLSCTVIAFYKNISQRLLNTVVFNGDTDPCVSYEGTRIAIEKVGWDVTAEYRPWFFNSTASDENILSTKPLLYGPDLALQSGGIQFAGHIVNYAHNLSFVTIHGSGHLVPQFRPRQSLHFLTHVLSGDPMSFSPPYPSFSGSESSFDDALNQWTDKAQSQPYV